MTTIVYRDGLLAADSAVFDRGVYCGEVQKIGYLDTPDGRVLFGAAGKLGDMQRFTTWMKGGRTGPRPEFDEGESEALVIEANGDVHWSGKTDSVMITGDYFAIGTGFKIALGAMAAGASALKAIEICCQMDNYTRAPTHLIALKP